MRLALHFVRIKVFLLTSLFYISASGQVAQPSGKIGVNASPGGIVEEIKSENPERIKGSIYLSDSWTQSNVYFKNGIKQLDIPVKYDLKNQVLKLKYKSNVSIVSEHRIKRFELFNNGVLTKTFVNVDEYDNIDTFGFFEVMLAGDISILSLTKIDFIKPNYVATHDVGEKDGKYVRKRILYLSNDNVVLAVGTKKPEFLAFFGEQEELIANYIKSNRLKYKKERDLIQIVQYYITL